MKDTKQRSRSILALVLSLAFTLCLLSGCGGGSESSSKAGSSKISSEISSESGESNGIVGLWESEDWGGICLELLDDGTGTIYTYSDIGDITYTWDGETLTLLNEREDGELEEVTGELQADGSLGIMGLGYFFPVEERSYGPDMAGSSFMEAGGMEGELEGDWIHSNGNRMLTFDGSGSLTFHETYEGGSSSSSSGWYSYDGETVTVDTSAGISEGYIDSDGDLIIEIDGEGGWYSRGDSSQLTYPDITGLEAEMVGYWRNDTTGDYVEFTSDGSVVYSIGGGIGFASPFTFDGETVTFSDYTGYIDSDGDLVVEGLDGWFSRSESSGGDDSGDGDVEYVLDGAYDNNTSYYSIVFYPDGTCTVSTAYDSADGHYILEEGDSIFLMAGDAIGDGYYDSSNNTFTMNGMDGYFYGVESPYYTP